PWRRPAASGKHHERGAQGDSGSCSCVHPVPLRESLPKCGLIRPADSGRAAGSWPIVAAMRGRFIVVEGIDGSGKSTMAARIARFERPDLAALLDLSPAVARKRAGDRHDRVESKGAAYQNRVRRAFLEIARRDRKRFRIIDAARPADEVFDELRKAVDRVL